MNIIFLDVDGVLNSLADIEYGNQEEITDYHLKMLAEIYHTCNAKIVLSSTWRCLDDDSDCCGMYQYLLRRLDQYGMTIFSKTPVIGLNRPLEIKSWLENQSKKEKIRFVILDDDFSKEKYDEYGIGEYLIKTEFFCKDITKGGLQQEHTDKAIKMFRR